MKIKLLFLLILPFTFSNAQIYQFDKLITTELKGRTGILISTDQRLVNSENDGFYLRFCTENQVELWDLNQNKFHVFNYSKGENEIVFFNYLYSCNDFKIEKEDINDWDFRVEKINDTEFILGKYKSNKSKKSIFSIRIIFEESEKSQINYLGHIKPFYEKELIKLMDSSKNYTVKKMTFFPNGKEAKTLELVNINDNKLEIKLPENLKYKCEY